MSFARVTFRWIFGWSLNTEIENKDINDRGISYVSHIAECARI